MFVPRATVQQHEIDRGDQVIIAGSVCLFIAVIGILIRCVARKWIVRNFSLDDWLLVFCFFEYTALVSIVIKMVDLGLGKHSNELDQNAMARLFKYIYVAEILYNTVTALIKVAFTLFYLRILQEMMRYRYSEKAVKYARGSLWILLAFIVCFGIFQTFLFIFQCTPVSHAWTIFIGSRGHCRSRNFLVDATYLHSAINGTVDLLLAISPIPVLWKMELGWRMKISVIGVLAVGALASLATFIRFKYIPGLPRQTSPDPLWSFEPLVLWSLVEPGLALFAAGLVVSRPLVNAMVRLIKRRNSHNHPDFTVSAAETEVEKLNSHK